MIKKAVIPVAGMGTRFLPITKAVAKEMLPIYDVPTIHLIVKECMDSGIEEVIFVNSNLKPEIEKYFTHNEVIENRIDDNKKKLLNEINEIIDRVKFHYIVQTEAKGSAHAIGFAKDLIDDDFFAVLYGDDLMDAKTPALKQLIDLHEKTNGNIIGSLEVKQEVISRYGILDLDSDNKIKSIVEKPAVEDAPSNVAGLGRYIVSSKIFDIIENLEPGANGEYQFTDAMGELMKKQDFYACIIDGTYYDIGNKLGYIKANINYALKHDDIKDDLKDYMKKE